MNVRLISLSAIVAAFAMIYFQGHRPLEVPIYNKYSKQITFQVDDVPLATDTLGTQSYRTALYHAFVKPEYSGAYESAQSKTKRYLECFSRDRQPMIAATTNGFFEAIHIAFGQHRNLVLSPDMVWLVISQGFALHLNENSQALRKFLVSHQGKKELVVSLDQYHIQLGKDDNNWEAVFQDFRDSIATHTSPELAHLIAGRFSGTDADAAVAFDMTLMDGMSPYFDYRGTILCGIPEITLEGTPEDWAQIEQRAVQLAQYDLAWWIKYLQPILAEFTQTAQGHPNHEFWASIVKDVTEPVCGGDVYISGWVTHLFPYIIQEGKYQRNPLLGLPNEKLFTRLQYQEREAFLTINGKKTDIRLPIYPPEGYQLCDRNQHQWVKYIGPKVMAENIPSGISTAILNIDQNGVLFEMELKSGFFGIRQNAKTKALRPEIGWAIIGSNRNHFHK